MLYYSESSEKNHKKHKYYNSVNSIKFWVNCHYYILLLSSVAYKKKCFHQGNCKFTLGLPFLCIVVYITLNFKPLSHLTWYLRKIMDSYKNLTGFLSVHCFVFIHLIYCVPVEMTGNC